MGQPPAVWSRLALAALIYASAVACLPEFDPELGAGSGGAARALCGEQGATCCEPPAALCAPELLCDAERQICARPPTLRCGSDADCRSGEVCCPAGLLGVCQSAEASCPVLDLVAAAPALDADAVALRYFDPELASDRCWIERGCVDGAGWRRLLGVSTVVSNVGTSDLLLGSPVETEAPTITTCGGERRFAGFLRYELLDSTGAKAQQEVAASCSPPPSSQFVAPFDCDFQGLWTGFSQTYASSLSDAARADECRWLDITDLLPGDYTLRVTVNPSRMLQESDFENNTPAERPLTIPSFDPAARCPELPNPLLSEGSERECGWVRAPFQADGAATPCEPGEEIALSCSSDRADVICGDYRVCDGPGACSHEASIRRESQPPCLLNSQPNLYLTCPASGQYSVWLASDAADAFRCEPYVFGAFDAVSTEPPPDAGAPVEP